MNRGRLLHARVVPELGPVLERALADGVTGYATVEPQDALLLDAAGRGVLALERGVPVAARHTETGRTGREALAELSIPGPCRVELYACDEPIDLAGEPGARVPPSLAAEMLADDPSLTDRIRAAAADRDAGQPTDADALETFLQDEERVRAIQREARREAVARAREWGLDDALAADAPASGSDDAADRDAPAEDVAGRGDPTERIGEPEVEPDG